MAKLFDIELFMTMKNIAEQRNKLLIRRSKATFVPKPEKYTYLRPVKQEFFAVLAGFWNEITKPFRAIHLPKKGNG